MSNQFPYPSNQNDGRNETKPETEQCQKQLSVFNSNIMFVPPRFGNEPNYY